MTAEEARKEIHRLLIPKELAVDTVADRMEAFMISMRFGLPDPVTGSGTSYGEQLRIKKLRESYRGGAS